MEHEALLLPRKKHQNLYRTTCQTTSSTLGVDLPAPLAQWQSARFTFVWLQVRVLREAPTLEVEISVTTPQRRYAGVCSPAKRLYLSSLRSISLDAREHDREMCAQAAQKLAGGWEYYYAEVSTGVFCLFNIETLDPVKYAPMVLHE